MIKAQETHEGITYTVKQLRSGHLCGYCTFPSRPVKEGKYSGLLTYVPVHGGITWAQEEKDGSFTYGFDCAHVGDELVEQHQNVQWVLTHAKAMARFIEIAVSFEERYLEATDDSQKASVIDSYHDACRKLGGEFELHDNFGAMINVLFGNL